jgi:hypothetical protein
MYSRVMPLESQHKGASHESIFNEHNLLEHLSIIEEVRLRLNFAL